MFLLSWSLRGRHSPVRDRSKRSFRPSLENLEDRCVPSTAPPSIIAHGAGNGAAVDVYDAASGQFKYEFQAFEGFNGGVRVAVGNANGQDYVVAAAGPGGFLVRTFQAGSNGATQVGQFEPFGTFSGGLNVAVGDLKGDGGLDVVTGADAAPNGSAILSATDLFGNMISGYVPAYEAGFHGGVRVAVGDFSGTGQDDIAAAAGPGGLPFVETINGRNFQVESRFLAFDPGFTDGVYVAAGRLDNSGVERLVVGAGGGHAFDEPVLREFDASGNMLHDYVYAFDPSYHGGVALSTTRPSASSPDNILADPVGDHSLPVQALDGLFGQVSQLSSPGANFFPSFPISDTVDNGNPGGNPDVNTGTAAAAQAGFPSPFVDPAAFQQMVRQQILQTQQQIQQTQQLPTPPNPATFQQMVRQQIAQITQQVMQQSQEIIQQSQQQTTAPQQPGNPSDTGNVGASGNSSDTGDVSPSGPPAQADDTQAYINQIYQDQKQLTDYLNSIQQTQDYINQIYQDQKDLNDYLNSIWSSS
jgi:hypothetical protein